MFTKTGRNNEDLMFEDARIIFRNFRGEKGPYNREGKKQFCLLLDENDANILKREGWNVKILAPREEGDQPQGYIQVTVNFDGPYPPGIYIINGGTKVQLYDDSVEVLDTAEITHVELIIHPYRWENPSISPPSGITAYLNSMYVVIYQSPLDKKYSNVGQEDRDI